ncbi:MAG: Holliday junction branch migration protein RuvA [Methanoregulaceae archaeon]|jgi:Holliday junction DNA helicase RuvA|nr:Holliday junction branch migration protein RuvA [Methanoregulaceae archaeon]
MISSLSGDVEYVGDGYAVIGVRGVGYQVRMTAPGLTTVRSAKGPVRLFTHLVVRDDELALYGFLHQSERELFLMLISVTRVGPVLALSVLSQIAIPDFVAAIIDEDEGILTSISGVGKKNAKRLILELKEKLEKRAVEFSGDMPAGYDPLRRDAVSALVALGFSQKDSAAAVTKATEGKAPGQVSVVIKAALRELKEK